MRPNLVERLENLVAFLEEARAAVDRDDDTGTLDRIGDAEGVAGEILTMVDGR